MLAAVQAGPIGRKPRLAQKKGEPGAPCSIIKQFTVSTQNRNIGFRGSRLRTSIMRAGQKKREKCH
jgi:hypothetical protein